MYCPSREEFIKKSKNGNLIPVYKDMIADLETPVSAFMKIDQGDYSYLLESVEGGEKIARYSFLGSGASLVFKSKGNLIEIISQKGIERFETDKDPLFEIERLMSKYKSISTKELPRFWGGSVGYLGYDMVRFFEDIPDKNPDDLGLPDSIFLLTDTMLIFDHIAHKIKILSNAHITGDPNQAYNEAVGKIDKIVDKLRKPVARHHPSVVTPTKIKMRSNFTEAEFKRAVMKIKDYIRAGDVIQAVLSQRFQVKLTSEPFDVYRALRSINPSPYMYYLRYKDLKLIGSSPELFVRCEDRCVQTRPIAGTRPRGRDDLEDERLADELLRDPKERAEHIMLVDLGRNDIGRVCKYGSVRVDELMVIEKYSHVMHIVSGCAGRLRQHKDQYDLIRSSFPAGTVTGAPKIRAMEIIDELEKTRRGPYAGAVGYFSFSGNLDTCITIRTIVIKGDCAYVQAGAGIVADSKPEAEYLETLNKAKAMMKAVEVAERGLE